jgi:PEP-CTERM motif
MKQLPVFVVAVALVAVCSARCAVVAQYDFEDTFTAGMAPSTDTDLTSVAGTFGAGSGISGFASSTFGDNQPTPFSTSAATGDVNGSPDGALFTGSSANQTTEAAAVTNNDYLSFTLTPVGLSYNFTQLQFKVAGVSGAATGVTYPEGFFVRTNQTGNTDISTGTISTTRTADGAFQLVTVNLSSVASLQNVATATEFRIYFYNPDGLNISTGDRVDKILLEGVAVPEPSTWAMLIAGAGLLGATQRLRRKRK